jgi:uncharacterized protein YndB with AHSA1/START domain
MGTMTEFERSQDIDAAPEAVWRVVSDPGRLAEWLPTTTASRPAGHDAVELVGESHGHDYDLQSGFVADDAARRLSWDSPRESGYRGELTVAEQPGGSRITVRLTIPLAPADADEEINRGLAEALERIGTLTEA